ncbi:hypothetical protein LY76DRAFT_586254 [Colletotrichum caudatum]|nr:hypothetical protein LY76DRAFT_586254 [Colletotrichum caudatum]
MDALICRRTESFVHPAREDAHTRTHAHHLHHSEASQASPTCLPASPRLGGYNNSASSLNETLLSGHRSGPGLDLGSASPRRSVIMVHRRGPTETTMGIYVSESRQKDTLCRVRRYMWCVPGRQRQRRCPPSDAVQQRREKMLIARPDDRLSH